MSLTLVASLAAQCAPQIASQTLVAIAKTESALNPLAIHDNKTGQSYAPDDSAEAISIARHLWDEGHSFDAGLMQVNSNNMAWLQLKLEDAFDPCKSLGAAGALLVSFSRYNRGDGVRGFSNGYVSRVVAATRGIETPQAPIKRKGGGEAQWESGATLQSHEANADQWLTLDGKPEHEDAMQKGD